jgi:hypothetical protein
VRRRSEREGGGVCERLEALEGQALEIHPGPSASV